MQDYIRKIIGARVYDVAIESPLDPLPRLSARIGGSALLTPAGAVDKTALLEAMRANPVLRREVENMVHSLTHKALEAFWIQQESLGVPLAAGQTGLTALAYIGGLMHLPIANASAIAQATPLALTAAGAILLGEAVGWRRWLSVAVGFCGILIIVRPGPDGFNAWALLILLSVVLVTIREISTRFIAPNTDTAVVSLVTQVMVTVACGLLAATEVWQPMDMMQTGLIVLASIGCLLGVHFSIDAMRHGDISLVAQFRYSFIPFAIFLGWLVWGDVPDLLTFVGIAVVAGSGIYVFYRERVRHQLLASRAEPGI